MSGKIYQLPNPMLPPPLFVIQREGRKNLSSLSTISFRTNYIHHLYQEHLKISEAKKKDLVNLCTKGIIPEELHGWFRNLKARVEVKDGLPEPAINDDTTSGDDE